MFEVALQLTPQQYLVLVKVHKHAAKTLQNRHMDVTAAAKMKAMRSYALT